MEHSGAETAFKPITQAECPSIRSANMPMVCYGQHDYFLAVASFLNFNFRYKCNFVSLLARLTLLNPSGKQYGISDSQKYDATYVFMAIDMIAINALNKNFPAINDRICTVCLSMNSKHQVLIASP